MQACEHSMGSRILRQFLMQQKGISGYFYSKEVLDNGASLYAEARLLFLIFLCHLDSALLSEPLFAGTKPCAICFTLVVIYHQVLGLKSWL